MLNNWAIDDAAREDPPGDAGSCSGSYYGNSIITVLSFGQPYLTDSGQYGVRNWTLTSYNMDTLATFATDYANDYFANSGVCSHVTVAIGFTNSNECGNNGNNPGCIYNEGWNLATGVGEAQSNLNNTGGDQPKQIAMAGGDDIEYDGTTSWDTYNQTINALNGFKDKGGYLMFDFGYTQEPCGDYQPPPSKCGSGGVDLNGNPVWDYGENYNVAWGIGLDVPLPESYIAAGFGGIWGRVYSHTANGCADCLSAGAIDFWGVMNNDGWNDPSNQYGTFWSYAGNPPQAADFDTCMPYYTNDTTSPCY